MKNDDTREFTSDNDIRDLSPKSSENSNLLYSVNIGDAMLIL